MSDRNSQIEDQIAEIEETIAEVDELMDGLGPSQSHFRPSLESCRNAITALVLLIEDWPSIIS
jgi:hypothetical protein